MDGSIHHIEIYVSDLSKSREFYSWLLTEVFSYRVYQEWETGISFISGETYIVLVQTKDRYLKNTYNRKNTGLNHIAFSCSSRDFVDWLTLELKRRNIPILYTDRHPYAGGEGYYAVFFEDPDRIKIEVTVSE